MFRVQVKDGMANDEYLDSVSIFSLPAIDHGNYDPSRKHRVSFPTPYQRNH